VQWNTHCKKRLFPAGESLVGDIPAKDGKTANLFLQCILYNNVISHNAFIYGGGGGEVYGFGLLPHIEQVQIV
jgi:hypothetical protein